MRRLPPETTTGSSEMSDPDKYRIAFNPASLYPWRLYAPGKSSAMGTFRTRERAVYVMDAHRRGADCNLFLDGKCGCRDECAR